MARITPNAFSRLLSILLLITPIIATGGRTIYVKRGGSIQKAINHARCGDKIVVARGPYQEQLVIKTDDITIVSDGAVLTPPSYLDPKNPCYRLAGNETDENQQQTMVPTHTGICIIGDVKLLEFVPGGEHRRVDKVRRRVKNVSLSGFTVKGFNGINIAVVGGQGVRVFKNKMIDGQKYGFLTLGSKNTRAEKNHITATAPPPIYLYFIALCMDDKSDVQIWNNHLSGYFVGLCVQTNGADVKGNHVEDMCWSVFVDPKIEGALVRWNHIGKNAPVCGFLPFPASYGIYVSGAINSEIRWNFIAGITDGGNPNKTAVGIAVYDNEDPPSIATGNKIRDNYLDKNTEDTDILIDSKGVNIAKNNKCDVAVPPSACS